MGLRDISRAEKYLQCTEKATAQAIIKIGDALTHYQKAVTSLKVSLSGMDLFSREQDSELFCLPSEKGFTLKGKNLLPLESWKINWGLYYFIILLKQ